MIILQVMFSRGLGGLERAYLDHATMLTARGHAVHCLVSGNAKSRAELERLARERGGLLQVHPVPAQGWARLLLRLRLGRLLRQLQPDAIVAHGAKSVSRFVPLRPKHVPLIAITHNASPRLMGGTHLLALTAEMERLYVSRGFAPARIHRVPNVLPARFIGLPQQAQRPLHQPLTIGVLARLVPKKGIDLFLRGLRLALDQGLQARALVGGDGELRESLQQLRNDLGLEQQVEFLGWVADSRQFYGQIDLLCVPSRDEPFGIVVLEGFAQGTPVIAAAVGGPRELIRDGVNGGLFAAGDPAALTQGLLKYARGEALAPLRLAAYADLPRYLPETVGAQLEDSITAACIDLRG
ncbi:glycosyltransferase family 1 protein [Solimonas sp. K1W22B-7]|uniref:glycosyltransferase n=1 Tax=Solimonas sp. K1W22B-7 TaxID=2303331 RepID=UPI000E3300A4|nr:glycosyltransferase [Solimonas sp. K1W22B-7]AXQ30263.1 glycosyltransferase family 1 protein [Solimonas sp. K1W22B-7]